MLKIITFSGTSDAGDILVQAIVPERGMTKTASTNALHPEMQRFISGLKSQPGKLYVLVNALGAGEYYGSNINGDYFEEKELDPADGSEFGYKTFLQSGVYRHHQNKDIQRSMGKVVFAIYNKTMHRVELIIEIDRAKAKQEGHGDLVEQLDAGKNPAVSMGCKVAFDVCSICGHKSKTRNDYCHHARTMMNQILPDGRKVFVYNPNPKFFDISFVLIGADRTSYAMSKVAFIQGRHTELSADVAEEYGLRDRSSIGSLQEKLANRQKFAALVKEIPSMSAKVMKGLEGRDRSLPDHVIDQMARQPIKKALTTAAAAGVVLKPSEYQRLLLTHMGKGEMAKGLAKQGAVFRPSSTADHSINIGDARDYDVEIRSMLAPYIRERSMFEPLVTDRLTTKTASVSRQETVRFVDDPLLGKIASGYCGYREQLLTKIGSMVSDITSRDAKLLAILGDSKLEDVFVVQDLAKSASAMPLALLGAVPMAYLYGAHQSGTGESGGSFGSFVSNHPVIATSVLVGLTRLGIGLKQSGLLDKQLNNLVGSFS